MAEKFYYYKDKSGKSVNYFGEQSAADAYAASQGWSAVSPVQPINNPTPSPASPVVPNTPATPVVQPKAPVVTPVTPAVTITPKVITTPATPAVPTVAPPASSTYKIVPNDTLSAIAAKNGTTVSALMAANPSITNPNLIIAGQSLNIPSKASVTPPATSPVSPGSGNVQNMGANQSGESREQIQAKIEDIKKQIATATDQYTKEVSVQNLVEEAAKLGLEYPSDYLASLSAPQKPESERRQEIYDKYGISNLETAAFQRPEKTFQQIYEQALIDNGLTSKQAALTAAQAELDKATSDYNTAVGEANKNPWKSESGRVGAVRRITESYQPEATRLQNKVTNLQSQIDNIKADAKDIASRTLSELEAEIQLDQQQLDYLTTKAENELKAQTAEYEETSSKELLRYYPEYVQNLAKAAKSTQIIEIGGQKILYAFDDAGNVVNKTVLGASDSEKQTPTEKATELKKSAIAQAAPELENSKGTDGYVDPAVYMKLRTDYASAVGSVSDFDNAFASMLSPAERQRLGIGKFSAASVDDGGIF